MTKDFLYNKKWLYQKYIIEELNTPQIAKICGCVSTTVLNYLKKYNIPIRTISESNTGRINFTDQQKMEMSKNALSDRGFSLLNDREWLYKKYSKEKMTIKKIAVICECSTYTVWTFLKRHEIKTRTRAESNMSTTALGFLNNEKWLYQKYIIEELSARKISKICDCNYLTVLNYLKKYNIQKRNKSETCVGNKNPSWKGGVSFEPYCQKFNSELKEEVRNNFNRTCFLCGKPEEENNNRCLSVHHVDYNKGQGCGHSWVLIPLCLKCHIKTNHNRYYWFNLLNNYWLYKYNLFTLIINVY